MPPRLETPRPQNPMNTADKQLTGSLYLQVLTEMRRFNQKSYQFKVAKM